MANEQEVLLDVQGLTVRFPVTGGVFLRKVGELRAVDDVSFTIHRGETLGLVGESGCGKKRLSAVQS
jgi:ABC-type glutathione transport system ATPase component